MLAVTSLEGSYCAASRAEGEEYFYYLTLYNESYPMPAMPEGAEEGILKGLYKLKPATRGKNTRRIYSAVARCSEKHYARKKFSRNNST